MRDLNTQTAATSTPSRPVAEHPHDHAVEFYESDERLCASVADFLGEGLTAGDRLVIIAQPSHRNGIVANLRSLGHDLDAPSCTGRIAWLDAQQSLASILTEGRPDWERLQQCFCSALDSLPSREGGVRAYGEMVDLLWKDGQPRAALELEELWNSLGRLHPFSLRCAYAMGHFYGEAKQADLKEVCRAHSHVVSEVFVQDRSAPNHQQEEGHGASAGSGHQQDGGFAALRQRTEALEREIEQRKVLERALREALAERRRAEDALRESERQLRTVTDALPSLIALTGPDHRLRFGSRAWQRWFGADPSSLPGGHLRELIGSAGFAQLQSHLQRALEGHGGTASLRLPLAFGERDVEGRFVPLTGDSSSASGVVMHLADVTEAREADRQVQRERAQLLESERAANRAKDEFMAMLGHELRNPLSPIVTALDLMRMRLGDAAAKEREVIERQVNHLSRLVDDLLDISRITRGKVELSHEPVDLAQAAYKAIEMASPLFEEKQHRLTTCIDGPLWLSGDEHRLAQVIANLLTNAARYTDPGGSISLSVVVDEGSAVVRVRDDGIGISAELMPRLFELFVQGERSADRAQGGLGLGLSIVRSMVILHGGTVVARSEGLGRGSEFVVRLPLPELGVVPAPVPANLGALGADSATGARRILIVDDNVDAAEVLAEVLCDFGHTTRAVFDGPSALACVREFMPDVTLMDIGLPLMDGYELARRLRALPELANMRLVAITGYGQSSDHQRSRDAGMDAHLVKPVDFDQIRAVIDQLFL